MIGSGLKKLAQELGMKVGKGVAYGSLRGYAAAFSEGAGYKQLVFTTKFPEPDQRAALLAAAQGVDLRKTYRVEQLEAMDDGILVVFRDDPETMAKIRAFLNWFVPLLLQYGATPANVCTQCGAQIERGRWVLIGGGAFYLHDACLEKIGGTWKRIWRRRGRRTPALMSAAPSARSWARPWALWPGPW